MSIKKLTVSETMLRGSNESHDLIAKLNQDIVVVVERLQPEIVEISALPKGVCFCGRPECVAPTLPKLVENDKFLNDVLQEARQRTGLITLQRTAAADIVSDLAGSGTDGAAFVQRLSTSLSLEIVRRATKLASVLEIEMLIAACRVAREVDIDDLGDDLVLDDETQDDARVVH